MKVNGKEVKVTLAKTKSKCLILEAEDGDGYKFVLFHLSSLGKVTRISSVSPKLGFKLDNLGRVEVGSVLDIMG